MKRLLAYMLGITLVMSSMSTAYAEVGTAAVDTRLVKSKGLATIYAVVEGKKMAVPKKAFKTGIFDKKDVEVIPYKELSKIPRVKYVSSDDSQKVYSLSTSGKRTLIGTEESVSQAVQSAVVEIPQEQVEMFTLSFKTVYSGGSGLQFDKGELTIVPFVVENPYSMLGNYFINNKGHIAFGDQYWDGKTLKKVNNLTDYDAIIVGLNDNDQMVGTLQPKDVTGDSFGSPSNKPKGFLWENGELKILPQISASHRVVGISNDGTIWGYKMGDVMKSPVGYDYRRDQGTGFFSIKNGVLHEIFRFKDVVTITRVNSSGHALGQSEIKSESGVPVQSQFLFKEGQIIDLGVIDPTYVYLYDINNADQIVGVSKKGPFIWQDGNAKIIAEDDGGVYQINNSGILLGEDKIHGKAIWKNGEAMSIKKIFEKQLARFKDMYAFDTFSINDNNQIIGVINDGATHLFVATLPDNIAPQLEFKGDTQVFDNFDYANLDGGHWLENHPQPDSLTLEWRVFDPEDKVKVSIYYYTEDQIGKGVEGTLLGTFKAEDTTQATMYRNAIPVNKQIFFYALIDDGVNAPTRVNGKQLKEVLTRITNPLIK